LLSEKKRNQALQLPCASSIFELSVRERWKE
jgi:hypothetical protein